MPNGIYFYFINIGDTKMQSESFYEWNILAFKI